MTYMYLQRSEAILGDFIKYSKVDQSYDITMLMKCYMYFIICMQQLLRTCILEFKKNGLFIYLFFQLETILADLKKKITKQIDSWYLQQNQLEKKQLKSHFSDFFSKLKSQYQIIVVSIFEKTAASKLKIYFIIKDVKLYGHHY